MPLVFITQVISNRFRLKVCNMFFFCKVGIIIRFCILIRIELRRSVGAAMQINNTFHACSEVGYFAFVICICICNEYIYNLYNIRYVNKFREKKNYHEVSSNQCLDFGNNVIIILVYLVSYGVPKHKLWIWIFVTFKMPKHLWI